MSHPSLFSVLFITSFLFDITMSTRGPMESSENTNKFALDLYLQLRNYSKNVIVSPISVQIVLSMVEQGAKGKTADEIAKVLHIPEENDKALEGYKALISGLDQPVLKLANKLFLETSLPVVPDFLTILTKYFFSDVQQEDFKRNPESAVKNINNWAEEVTAHKIKDLLSLDMIDVDTKLVLVNAIYFKAEWQTAFVKELTEDMPFFVTPDNPVNVKMMVLKEQTFPYKDSQNLGAQIIEIPYKGNSFSMIIILPKTLDGLAEVESKLENLDFYEELSELTKTKVNLYLPRFKLESTIDMNDILTKLGISTAFSDEADFSGISTEKLSISKVYQKAFIEVNEEGTEAAAATVGALRKRRAIVDGPPVISCDHPFGFIIVHSSTGSVIFESRVTDPSLFSSSQYKTVHEEL